MVKFSHDSIQELHFKNIQVCVAVFLVFLCLYLVGIALDRHDKIDETNAKVEK